MRRLFGLILGILCLTTSAPAQVQELFSEYLQVFRPKGTFPSRLVKATPPPTTRWKNYGGEGEGFRLRLPDNAEVDTRPDGSRRLQAVLAGSTAKPLPTLRVDLFDPQEGDPEEVDGEYVTELVTEYPKQAFGGKFVVTDSGHVLLGRKWNVAVIGGEYVGGGRQTYRMQATLLSPSRQVYLTFDCAAAGWEQYQDVLARILLSLEGPARKDKR
ncbi:MAG: hypothetical protein FJX77_12515 [Armatimonadetes bacterium]|nr:hypothetical protein [Armatimonadota bacterium]